MEQNNRLLAHWYIHCTSCRFTMTQCTISDTHSEKRISFTSTSERLKSEIKTQQSVMSQRAMHLSSSFTIQSQTHWLKHRYRQAAIRRLKIPLHHFSGIATMWGPIPETWFTSWESQQFVKLKASVFYKQNRQSIIIMVIAVRGQTVVSYTFIRTWVETPCMWHCAVCTTLWELPADSFPKQMEAWQEAGPPGCPVAQAESRVREGKPSFCSPVRCNWDLLADLTATAVFQGTSVV